MNRKLQTLGCIATALIASLASGGVAQAKTLKGTVVHRIAHARAFVITDSQGRMVAIHASRSPAVGRSVRVEVRRLRNGRLAAKRVTVGRRIRSARIRGTVTFANRRGRAFVVSARGVSLLVHRAAVRGTRARSAAVADVPAVGTIVTVDASLDQHGEVQADNVDEHGEDTGTIDLEGVITAIDAATRTLTISADDDDESGASVTVHLPAAFDLSSFTVGDAVELDAMLNDDGTYTAVYASQDNDADDADDTSDDQGVNEDGEANQNDDSDRSGADAKHDAAPADNTAADHGPNDDGQPDNHHDEGSDG